MVRLAQNDAEARHVGEIRDQLVAAISPRLAVVLRSDPILIGTLRGNLSGGYYPHHYGSLRLELDGGQETEIDFLDIKLIGQA